MISELAKHIENLLLENDCVIIPGFGGFIAQYIPSRRVEEENLFLPPYRTVGFNPQLNLNDGLLIQSYMQVYDVNYPKALRMVEEAVAELRETLSKSGEVTIHGVGKLTLNIEDMIAFVPNEAGVLSPALYGLSSFEMAELTQEILEPIHKPSVEQPADDKQKHNTLIIRINRKWLNNAVAVAAAVILFFVLSTPVDNTYVEPENYASLGDASLFDLIRSQSAATTLVEVKAEEPKHAAAPKPVVAKKSVAEKPVAKSVAPAPETKPEVPAEKPVAEKPEAVAPVKAAPQEAPAKAAVKKQKHYHIIVASVTNVADAEKTIAYFAEKGYPGGTVVEGDGRVRIAISSFTDRKAADEKWAELRKIELFQNAWILVSRK